MRLSCKGWFVIVICGDGNCSRRATVRLGIDTLIANILVIIIVQENEVEKMA